MKKLLLLLLLSFVAFAKAEPDRPVTVNKTTLDLSPAYAAKAEFGFALSDESTSLTTGTKVTWRTPYAFTITSVRACLTAASSSGIPTIDIKQNGSSIFSTKLTIDANELSSTSAATPYVFVSNPTTIADDVQITFSIDTAGTGSKGLKVYILGHK